MPYIIIGIVIILLAWLILANVRIVPQAQAYVIENLGKFKTVWYAGLHLKIPFVERIVNKVSMKEQIGDFPPQPVITGDNVTIQIDTVVYYTVTDARLYTYGVEHPVSAMELLTATTLRNIIGKMTLDETLTSRDVINNSMRTYIDEATDPWGIKVIRVELKSITPPEEIRSAMEKQMKAEREKREQILIAEGKKEAAITAAEGQKRAAILEAEAKKEKLILEAEAQKEAAIKQAEGKAEAIRVVSEAQASGFEKLNMVGIKPDILKLKSYESMEKVANGRATKLVVPSDMVNMATLLSETKFALESAVKDTENKSDLSLWNDNLDDDDSELLTNP